jgi:hypothetical protein
LIKLEKPRYQTKQTLKIMENEAKLDLILKKISETETKLVSLEKASHSDMLTLKTAVDSWRPQLEKKVTDLASTVGALQLQLDQLQASGKVELTSETAGQIGARNAADLRAEVLGMRSQSPPPANGTNENSFSTPAPYFHDPAMRSALTGNSVGVSSGLPPVPCPQFDGDNPQMWRENCEAYFDTYGVNAAHWVRIANLNFVGNASFWLQSVRSQLIGVTWVELCEKVCAKFSRDRYQQLIRQYIHVRQVGSVTDYVEKFDSLMHQMIAYDSDLKPVYFVTKFVEGLKDAICTVIMVQRPQDLDTACSLALLQEEAMLGTRRVEISTPAKSITKNSAPLPVPLLSPRPAVYEEKKTPETAKSNFREDRLSSLKAYRKSKGLCFTCGERWVP